MPRRGDDRRRAARVGERPAHLCADGGFDTAGAVVSEDSHADRLPGSGPGRRSQFQRGTGVAAALRIDVEPQDTIGRADPDLRRAHRRVSMLTLISQYRVVPVSSAPIPHRKSLTA